MAKLTLKSILGKKNETTAWLNLWTKKSNSAISIEDINHTVLFESSPAQKPHSFPIEFDGDILGYLNSDENSDLIASLLILFLQKETEKKKLGTEVLNLYQELNVIYNFSEKLTETIEPDTIARLTLEQAMHSIPSHSGVIILWDEETKALNIPAFTGDVLFDKDGLRKHPGTLLKIGLSGQSVIMDDLTVLKEKGIISNNVSSLIYAAMKVKLRILGAIILARTDSDSYTAAHLKLLVTLALQSSTAIESALLYEKNIREVREREEAILKIHEVTKKFVPNEFIRLLGKEQITDVKLGDQAEKNVTVLFTDIRDFTTLSEKMTPGENFRFVSSFNERLGPIIRNHHGFINQYLGDSIMAIFPGDPDNALHAAIDMQKAVEELNIERGKKGLSAIKAGIGMHTGPLIMGITGDEYRLDAATISDTVNTASRIESLTKYYRSPLLLSAETLDLVSDRKAFQLRHLGKVQLKGKFNTLSIVECINGYTGESRQKKLDSLPDFNEGMRSYFEKKFEEASRLFQNILDNDPEDQTTQYFMEKAMKYSRHGIPENWSGAEEMHSK